MRDPLRTARRVSTRAVGMFTEAKGELLRANGMLLDQVERDRDALEALHNRITEALSEVEINDVTIDALEQFIPHNCAEGV